MRPLPELTPANEWFWTSGRRRRAPHAGLPGLRTLVHPPTPICPTCRSRSSKPVAVSGRGTVVGFTVNEHQWLPAFEPPYVDRQRGAGRGPERPPHDQHRRLRAGRRRHRPGGRGALRAARRRLAPAVRADRRRSTRSIGCPNRRARSPARRWATSASSTAPSCRGVGRSQIGRRLMVDPLSLTVDACLAAVADAGLTLDDIDGLSTYPGRGRHGHERGRRRPPSRRRCVCTRRGSTAAATCPDRAAR